MMATGTQTCIDRDAEQEIFDGMVKIEDLARLLTIRDGGGRGKSSLLRQLRYNCVWRCKPSVPASLVSLDWVENPTRLALVDEIVNDLTSDELPNPVGFPTYARLNEARALRDFSAFVGPTAAQSGTIHAEGAIVSGTSNVLTGQAVIVSNAHIDNLNVSREWTPAMDGIAERRCIDAFFSDLRTACEQQPVVLLLDAWERGNPELNTWIAGALLGRHVLDLDRRPARLLVVLAGRELPDFQDMFGEEILGQVLRSIESLGDWEAAHVRQFLALHGYSEIDNEDVEYLCFKLRKERWPLQRVLSVYRKTFED